MKITLAILCLFLGAMSDAAAQELRVFSGYEQSIAWMESIGWWGEDLRAEQLKVPRTLLIAISPRWQEQAATMPVPVKKEFFYRCLLPLVAHANWLVRQRRAWLHERDAELAAGKAPRGENLENLQKFAVALRVKSEQEASETSDPQEWRKIIEEILYRLDEIPAGLAIGQAAYESGWGTSRFTAEGNALFGQWTYGGDGIAPEQQRKELGDHRIASFNWPFDSVRGYFLNLSTHPAYEEFRKLRADLKSKGKPLDSLTLADGLVNYSERGQPLAFAMGAEDEEAARSITQSFEEKKKSGELDRIVEEMRLE